MGNYVSCALTAAKPRSSAAAAAQVILPTAEIRHVAASGALTSAADLMLDFPGHFLVNSRSLRIAARFPALSADEDLEPGNVYVMFPMHRVSSLVTAADMGPLVLAAGKAGCRAFGDRARVLPEVAPPPEPAVPRVKVDDDVEDEWVSEFRNRLSLCRSRRPRLDTITEESCAYS